VLPVSTWGVSVLPVSARDESALRASLAEADPWSGLASG
jgi:hypothetical protein